MEQTPNPAPLAIPWFRSKVVLVGALVVPWFLRMFPSGSPQHGDMTCLVIALFWQVTHAVWGACLLALAFRRAELSAAVGLLNAAILTNLALSVGAAAPHEREFLPLLFGVFVAQVVGGAVTLALRFSYTLAQQQELMPAPDQQHSQFSLRALFVATLVLALSAALFSYAVQSRGSGLTNDLIPWLTMIIIALLWNELLQVRLRVLPIFVGSFVWGGLWAWRSLERGLQWPFFVSFTAIVYGLPIAYRWAGWRMVRRAELQNSEAKLKPESASGEPEQSASTSA